MTIEEKQLLEEIRNQNSMMLARLVRIEEQIGVTDEVDLSVNLSAINRVEDPVQYLRDRNRQIKMSGRLKKMG